MFRRPSTTSTERSAEERARAAAERAARRAARDGRPLAPPPPETFGARAARGTGGETPPTPAAEPPDAPDAATASADVRDADEPTAPAEASAPEAEPEPTAPAGAGPLTDDESEPTVPAGAGPLTDDESEPTVPAGAGPLTDDESEPEMHEAAGASDQPPGAPAYAAGEHEGPAPAPVGAVAAGTAGPDEGTVEWTAPPETMAAAQPEETPEPTRALPVAPSPASRPAAAPPRGRWRRQRGSDTLAPVRPRAIADDGRGRGRVLALLALALIAVALYVINATFQPFHGDGRGAVAVTVPAGADAGRIGDVLAAHDVVASGRFFSLNATLTRRRGGLLPGDYTLPRELSNGAAIEALTRGPKVKAIETFKLTIPEGRSVHETAGRLKDVVDGDYAAAARSPAALRRARRLGLPRGAKTLEGYLFPATYELPRGSTASELVDRQLTGFADNTAKVSYTRAKRRRLSRYDVLNIASMIDREAQLDRERPLISAVIYNRLRRGMPLGIDATIRYATNNWSRPLRVSELERDGPYNSRTRRGLPPTPVGNPGLASIRAAARPARVGYLYYVVKPGSKGAHAFSSTDAQFQRDVSRYQKARNAKNGQAP